LCWVCVVVCVCQWVVCVCVCVSVGCVGGVWLGGVVGGCCVCVCVCLWVVCVCVCVCVCVHVCMVIHHAVCVVSFGGAARPDVMDSQQATCDGCCMLHPHLSP